MKQFFMCLLIMLSSAIGLSGSDRDDGYMWTNYDKGDSGMAFKLGFLMGFKHVSTLVTAFSQDFEMMLDTNSLPNDCDSSNLAILTDLQKVIPKPNLSYGDLIKGIDDFYKDYANKGLPIFIAIKYMGMRIEGVSEDSLQKSLEEWRKLTTLPLKKK